MDAVAESAAASFLIISREIMEVPDFESNKHTTRQPAWFL